MKLEKCPECGYVDGHEWTCPTIANDDVVVPEIRNARQRIATMEAQIDALRAHHDRLMDDIDEVIMLLQDFEYTDDYTARLAARALLTEAVSIDTRTESEFTQEAT